MPTPPIKASTSTKSRQIRVPDVQSSQSNQLMTAIAAAMSAGSAGRQSMDKISTKLQQREKEQHTKAMSKKK